MRLVTYESNGLWHSGILVGEWIVNTSVAAEHARLSGVLESEQFSNKYIIQLSSDQQSALVRAARALVDKEPAPPNVIRIEDSFLGPPIPDPDKIICLGLNYRTHAEETGFSIPQVPILFAKYRNALNGPTGEIVLPGMSKEIDYEGELAVVIGKRCKNVPAEDALEYVAGYMALMDVSARDLQFRSGQWLSGKALDTFAPCGPALVTDEIDDPQNLAISTRVNGQTLQKGNTRDMIFSVQVTISYISRLMTLEPGDIIATGTPEGVGFKRNPPIFLQDGDIVEVEIQGIGTLRNPVIGNGK